MGDRECISGEILARTSLSATQDDLAELLTVKAALDVPIVGVVSDGQRPFAKRRNAPPEAAHGLCHFTLR